MEIDLNKKFNDEIKKIPTNVKPNLFLHICCGPCSTAVLDRISKYFKIYIIFYNPNIDTNDEFIKRLIEFHKVIDINNYDINLLYDSYNHDEFLKETEGYENEPEGGKRCEICFKLRLCKSFDIAKKYIIDNNLDNSINYLCTTLSISPHKNAKLIYNIGVDICSKCDFINYLPSDFKKENGYLKSIELSKKYGLYRQSYCGCEFAKCINNVKNEY